MGLFEFYRKAGDYASPDSSAMEKAGEAGQKHSSYHKKIVLISGIFGIAGAALGVVFLLPGVSETKSGTNGRVPLLAPLLFGAGGLLFGVAIACLFAPQEFLTGPLGEKWMTLIGTKNVLVARIVCLLLGLVVAVPIVIFGWLSGLG